MHPTCMHCTDPIIIVSSIGGFLVLIFLVGLPIIILLWIKCKKLRQQKNVKRSLQVLYYNAAMANINSSPIAVNFYPLLPEFMITSDKN